MGTISPTSWMTRDSGIGLTRAKLVYHSLVCPKFNVLTMFCQATLQGEHDVV